MWADIQETMETKGQKSQRVFPNSILQAAK